MVDPSSWDLENEEEPEHKHEFKPKAHLVLEGSERHEWGVVKDCHRLVNVIPDDAEVVGTWNKYGNGTYWVDLTTPLSALEDTAIQLYAELAKSRAEAMSRIDRVTPVKRSPRSKASPKVEEPKIALFDQLRAKLKTDAKQ